MNPLRAIGLFCGSSPGIQPTFRAAAAELGRTFAARGIRLVFGGGSVGLMGAAADACLAAGGEAVGVIPRLLLEKEVGHRGLTALHVVETMHARKALMTELADGFIALPGGYGTLDELFEALTWQQLGYHRKPVGILNTGGYFNPLLAFMDHARDAGFLRPLHHDALCVDQDLPSLLEKLRAAEAPDTGLWLDRQQRELAQRAQP